MKRTDLAYFAGIIDGEGSISLIKRNKRTKSNTFTLTVIVGNTNEWLIQQLKFSFGGGVYLIEGGGNNKDSWQWKICARKALIFLESVYPYLKIKKPQARIAITFQKHKKRSGIKGCSTQYLDFEGELREAITRLNKRGKPS